MSWTHSILIMAMNISPRSLHLETQQADQQEVAGEASEPSDNVVSIENILPLRPKKKRPDKDADVIQFQKRTKNEKNI